MVLMIASIVISKLLHYIILVTIRVVCASVRPSRPIRFVSVQ
jgi:hypothetical protein